MMRRIWLAMPLLGLLMGCGPGAKMIHESRQATGVKVGEIGPDSAVVWMRVTEKAQRRADGEYRHARAKKVMTPPLDPLTLQGSVPGAPGRARVRYSTDANLAGAVETEWKTVTAEDDYTAKFVLEGLEPATRYYFLTDTSSPDGSVLYEPLRGGFETAPRPDAETDATFTVITGQAHRDTDCDDGFLIYDAMARLKPKFIVPTGDTVYYDSDDPLVTSIALARYHWHRVYSLPSLLRFHLKVPGYWEKDDHDSYHDDNWPGLSHDYMGTFSFEQGLKVYAEQTPLNGLPYRTVRWGKGLQIWLMEGRDYRSPNTMPDGPDKTIWGAKQKQWLKDTMLAGDADWRILISPTPIVGPDRANKGDNHANAAFAHEGNEIRQWIKDNVQANTFVVCGDRHWQYHSVHPETGLQEFSCGPVSDQHAGGTPGLNKKYHRYHNVIGGFLSVSVKTTPAHQIQFRFHDVNGDVQYSYTQSKPL